MRTKTLLLAAAAIAAGVISSQAQSNVYSANVVGYVNKSFDAFLFKLIVNPMNNTNNLLSTIIPSAPDGTSVFQWNVGNQDLDIVVPTFFTGSGWSPDVSVPAGQAFFVMGSENFTNTFVGEVRQGALTNAVSGGFLFDAVGSQAPIGGNVTNIMVGFPAADGDSIFKWNVVNQDLDIVVSTYFTGSGWTPEVDFEVGEGFFLMGTGGAVDWVHNFTVQ